MRAPSSPSLVSRRQALVAGTAGLVGAATGPLAGQSPDQAARVRVPADPTKIQGPGSTPMGARSPFERPVRTGRGTSSQTPLQDLTGIITPADLHFERHHAGVPAIDPERVLAARPRPGRASHRVHAGRLEAVSRPIDHPLPRVFGQWRPRVPRRSAGRRGHAAADRRLDEHQRMDRRAARDAVSRSRCLAQGRAGSSPRRWTRR